MTTKIYIEGGGNTERTLKACRAAFSKYCEMVVPAGHNPRVVACGSRQEAYEDFKKGLNDAKYDRVALLVDSEIAIAKGDTGWKHLKKSDNWDKPTGAQDDAAHLMVQSMESWFMAHKEHLNDYYGQNFNSNALPQNPAVEEISKQDVCSGLKNATRLTSKGSYDKAKHGFEILSGIDPNKVEKASPFARLLHEYLKL